MNAADFYPGLDWKLNDARDKYTLGHMGGSDGCINFGDSDNKGLLKCLKKFGLPDIYKNHCCKVSLADFIVIAAEALMGRTSPDYNQDDPFSDETTAGKFFKTFRFGRET